MMIKTLGWAAVWLLLIAGMFACIAAFQSNGATDHPLLVDSAISATVVPWTLNTRCTISSDNLPQREPERNA